MCQIEFVIAGNSDGQRLTQKMVNIRITRNTLFVSSTESAFKSFEWHRIDLHVAFRMHRIELFDSAHVNSMSKAGFKRERALINDRFLDLQVILLSLDLKSLRCFLLDVK